MKTHTFFFSLVGRTIAFPTAQVQTITIHHTAKFTALLRTKRSNFIIPCARKRCLDIKYIGEGLPIVHRPWLFFGIGMWNWDYDLNLVSRLFTQSHPSGRLAHSAAASQQLQFVAIRSWAISWKGPSPAINGPLLPSCHFQTIGGNIRGTWPHLRSHPASTPSCPTRHLHRPASRRWSWWRRHLLSLPD